jgi:glycosyltransferase involved in cell wall biosynthesis
VKKALMVTYYFPPSGGSGVQRTLKFVRYLPEFGIQPVVLSARNADYPIFDYTLMDQIPPHVNVYRSFIFEPYSLYRRLTARQREESTDIATLSFSESDRASLAERLSEWIRSVFFIPDARIGWLPFAVLKGIRVIQRERPDIIYSSAPPYTTHLIALVLSKHFRLPWIADFRDSWIGWLSTPQWRPTFSRALEMKMERAALRYAQRIITVSRGVHADLYSRHSHLPAGKWILLPNGYDPSDYGRAKPRDPRLVITYLGSMYGKRNPRTLIEALEVLYRKDKTLSARILIRLVGRIGKPILERIKTSPVSGLFQVISYVDHAESLAYLMATDLCLLIIDDAPGNEGILTGKLFEYIGSGQPILALAPKGEALDLIKKQNLGVCIKPNDVDSMADTLKGFLQLHSTYGRIPKVDSAVKERFDRRYQSGILANHLKRCILRGDI